MYRVIWQHVNEWEADRTHFSAVFYNKWKAMRFLYERSAEDSEHYYAVIEIRKESVHAGYSFIQARYYK